MSRRTIALDWFNVTYRSVLLTVGLIVATLATLGGVWYHKTKIAPRAAASREIDSARTLLARVDGHGGDGGLFDEVRGNAREALTAARAEFTGGRYREATVSAIRSQTFSNQALTLVEGEETEAEVRFIRIEGDVRVKPAGQFAWSAARRDMRLSVGDQIKTSSNGSAQVLYFDGTKTTISPGSLLEIRDLYEDPVTKVRRVREQLSWGVVQASTRESNVSGSYHELSTDTAQARAVEAGEYRIEHDKDTGASSFSAFDGGALELSSSNSKTTLAAGERVAAGRGGTFSAKELLPGVPRLIGPQDQRVFISEDPATRGISLSWEGVPAASNYELAISTESLFAQPLYRAERGDTRAELDVPPVGDYYWRVAAVNAAGQRGRYSETRRFRVTSQRIRDDSDRVPPILEVEESVLNGNVLILNGRTEPGAVLWIDDEKNEVHDDGRFYAVIRLRQEGWNELSLVSQDAAGNETRVPHRVHVELF